MFLVVSTLFGHLLKQVQLGEVIFTLECPARLHLSLKSLFVSVNEYHFPLIHAICENSSSSQQLLSCNQLRHKTSNITHIVQILVAPFSFKDWWSLEEPDCPGIERPHSVHSKSPLDKCHKPFSKTQMKILLVSRKLLWSTTKYPCPVKKRKVLPSESILIEK